MKTVDDSEKFIKALQNYDIKALRKVSKADLHNHSALGGNPEKTGIFPPQNFDGYIGMKQYIKTAFYPQMSVLGEYKKYVEATCEQAVDDGVIYLETSVDYRFLMMFASFYAAFEYLESLKNKYKSRCKINYDLGLSRGTFYDFAAAKDVLSSSIFSGIDLYGDERINRIKDFSQIFSFARDQGKICKAHVGEFCSATDIWDVFNVLALHEIQHGVHITDSDDVLKKFIGSDVTFNICITGNIKTGAVQNYENHPIRKMFDAGLNVTINTDDMLLFNTGISEEFLHLYDLKIFNGKELDIIRKNGLRRY